MEILTHAITVSVMPQRMALARALVAAMVGLGLGLVQAFL